MLVSRGTTPWFRVEYKGDRKLDTLNESEAQQYAQMLWVKDRQVGDAPTIDEHTPIASTVG